MKSLALMLVLFTLAGCVQAPVEPMVVYIEKPAELDPQLFEMQPYPTPPGVDATEAEVADFLAMLSGRLDLCYAQVGVIRDAYARKTKAEVPAQAVEAKSVYTEKSSNVR